MLEIKAPCDCTREEISEFRNFVRLGSDVMRTKLRRRIKAASHLLFYRDQETLCGISALKQLTEEYRIRLFERAEATVDPGDFLIELGWIFIGESYRGKKTSRILVQELLPYVEGGIYSTTRSDNFRMQKTLERYGFVRHGRPYLSERGDYELVLFIRKYENSA